MADYNYYMLVKPYVSVCSYSVRIDDLWIIIMQVINGFRDNLVEALKVKRHSHDKFDEQFLS